MSFIEEIKERAKSDIKTIVLPEATDIRVLEATDKILKEGFAKVILIGNEDEVFNKAKENNLDISKATVIDPANSEKYEGYVNTFYELRKHKGITIEQAKELILSSVYFGMMMVKQNEADGLVSGAAHSTADTLRPALQILKTAPNTKLVSTVSIMVVPNCEYGENGIFAFADCALNEKPNSDELSEIAISSAKSFKQFTGKDARVAMLSYSTYGSATSEDVTKVQEATKLAKEKAPDLMIDRRVTIRCSNHTKY